MTAREGARTDAASAAGSAARKQLRSMSMREKKEQKGNELKRFSIVTVILLFVAAFAMGSPAQIAAGMKVILLSRDALITDYFELAGYGAAFFNAGLVAAIAVSMTFIWKIPYTGLTVMAIFFNIGYGLWGKNPVNMLPLLAGTWLFALVNRVPFSNYIYTALFGTCLAPFVTEMLHILPFSSGTNLLLAVLLGIFMGYLLVPLSIRTASMHMGYSLFNVGFSGGVLAFVSVCVLRSFGVQTHPVLIWKEGIHGGLLAGVYLYLAGTFLYGWYLCGWKWKNFLHIMTHPGRAVADLPVLDGVGATLMNMGVMGLVGLTYIVAVGGDLSGPVLGGLAVLFGTSAFGAHPRNSLPVIAGVFLSTLMTSYSARLPGMQLAVLFAVGAAPIAGQFGPVAGVLAGALHAAIVMCTTGFYGGLNLYNNGFSTGWVAIIMVPLCESFRANYKVHKRKKDRQ